MYSTLLHKFDDDHALSHRLMSDIVRHIISESLIFLLLYIANFVEREYAGIFTDQMYTDESQLPKISAARKRYQTIIQEFEDTIIINNEALKLLTKEELVKLIVHLRCQLFNNSLLTTENDEETNDNNNQILRNLFDQSHNLTELMTKITETLPKLTSLKTIIQLSLTYIFVWTVKTHIAPAYSKYR